MLSPSFDRPTSPPTCRVVLALALFSGLPSRSRGSYMARAESHLRRSPVNLTSGAPGIPLSQFPARSMTRIRGLISTARGCIVASRPPPTSMDDARITHQDFPRELHHQ